MRLCISRRFHTWAAFFMLGIAGAFLLTPLLQSHQSGVATQEQAAASWSDAQVLHASDLARELASAKTESKATIVYVGFRTLFEGGHVPGASFHGTASKEEGLVELKKWLATLSRSTNLVIYCGCCPIDKCPNIRPAYAALHDMDFTHVRVLILPTSFAADWVEKGFPMEKGL